MCSGISYKTVLTKITCHQYMVLICQAPWSTTVKTESGSKWHSDKSQENGETIHKLYAGCRYTLEYEQISAFKSGLNAQGSLQSSSVIDNPSAEKEHSFGQQSITLSLACLCAWGSGEHMVNQPAREVTRNNRRSQVPSWSATHWLQAKGSMAPSEICCSLHYLRNPTFQWKPRREGQYWNPPVPGE